MGGLNAAKNCFLVCRIFNAYFLLRLSGHIVGTHCFAWNSIYLKTLVEPEMSFVLIKSLVVIIKRSFHSPAFSQMCRSIIQLHWHKNIWTIFFAKHFQFICKNCFARELGLLINMVGFWASFIFAAIYCNKVGNWIWQLNTILKVNFNFKTKCFIFIFSNKNYTNAIF